VLVDIQASEPHFLYHLVPVWRALDESERGSVYVADTKVAQVAENLELPISRGSTVPPSSTAIRLVASWGDLRRIRGQGRPIVFMEHGAGFTFGTRHESYAGGLGRDNVSLFLCPNQQVHDRNRHFYPDIPAEIVGCPKLDHLSTRSPVGRTVAVSFHWPARVVPETNWCFPEYRNALRYLAEQAECEVIGHGHPRVWPRLEEVYKRLDIEPVADFDEVLDRCDVYVHDSGSTLYESAAAGRGVIALNSRFYRRDVDHGLRFWQSIPGPQVDTADQLAPMVKYMLDGGWRSWEEARKAGVIAAYGSWGIDGGAAKRAAAAVRNHLG
jgi:hypothetical protein